MKKLITMPLPDILPAYCPTIGISTDSQLYELLINRLVDIAQDVIYGADVQLYTLTQLAKEFDIEYYIKEILELFVKNITIAIMDIASSMIVNSISGTRLIVISCLNETILLEERN